MNRSPRAKSWSRWSVAVLAFVCASCTLKIAYNYADWLTLWQIDHYFDLTEPQKDFLSSRLKTILARHRKEALPKYVSVLTQVRQKFKDGLSGEDVDWFFAAYEELRGELFELVVEDGTTFLVSTDGRQVEYLERMFDERNKEIEERLQEDTEERLAERAESTVDWIEDWLGALSREQERQITKMSLALPDTLEAWLDYRRHRQATFLRLVQGAQNGGADTQALRHWLMFPFEGAPQPYLEAREEMRVGVREMAVSIDRTMTPSQRIHLLEELDDVIDDMEGLSEV